METIIKRGRSAEFTIIANSALQDTNLSWKAKGMLAYIMSLPSDWKLSMADLAKRSTDGKSATRSAFNELIEAGYATREQQKVDGRFAGVIYTVTDKPNTDTSEPYSTFPHTEKPNTEKPHTENCTLQRNNIQRNNIQINNNKDIESENEFSQSFPSFNQNENSFISDVYGNPTFDREENQSTLNAETPDPQCSAAPPTPDAATQRETDAETLREFWNATLVSEGFPTVKKLNPQRITKAAQVVREMVKDGVTAEQLFDKIKNSDFLRSGCKSWFSFDWLIQKRARQFDANWKIIMSGKYDNVPSMQKKTKETPAHLKIDPEFAIKFLNNDF